MYEYVKTKVGKPHARQLKQNSRGAAHNNCE